MSRKVEPRREAQPFGTFNAVEKELRGRSKIKMRILLAGGGSGGHFYPLVAVAEKLSGQELYFIGSEKNQVKIMRDKGVKGFYLISGKLRRYFSFRIFLDLIQLPVGIIQSAWLVWKIMPDVIFSKGGYIGFFPVFWGWIFRIPVLIHESDSVPGLANKLSAPFAKRVAVSFQKAKDYFPEKKTALVGNPIRENVVDGRKEEALKKFGLSGKGLVLLVLGGSQGSRQLNEMILLSLSALTHEAEIIHQVGDKNFQIINLFIQKNFSQDILGRYHPVGFLNGDGYRDALAVSDLIISRSGAGVIFEIAAVGKPSVLIPLAFSAGGHQSQNAFEYASSGAAIVIESANLSPNLFTQRIVTLLKDVEGREQMSQAAKNFAKLDAAEKIAKELIKLGEL